jgi:hypothetical protein
MSLDVSLYMMRRTQIFDYNVTHLLGKMAEEAGIYTYLWRPEEIGVKLAGELIVPLRDGLTLLLSDPDRFKAMNPENGWGSYEGLVEFVRAYKKACEEFPDAEIYVSR